MNRARPMAHRRAELVEESTRRVGRAVIDKEKQDVAFGLRQKGRKKGGKSLFFVAQRHYYFPAQSSY
jgi:hypothetical protein